MIIQNQYFHVIISSISFGSNIKDSLVSQKVPLLVKKQNSHTLKFSSLQLLLMTRIPIAKNNVNNLSMLSM